MSKPKKGIFTPKNPQKYIGNNIKSITYRSTWELSVFIMLDSHPSVIGWASEVMPVRSFHDSGIAYRNPFTGRQSIYIPDIFVVYVDKYGKNHIDLVEIKPQNETPLPFGGHERKVNRIQEARRILNYSKFIAAVEHCKKHGWTFRVLTEKDLFAFTRKNT